MRAIIDSVMSYMTRFELRLSAAALMFVGALLLADLFRYFLGSYVNEYYGKMWDSVELAVAMWTTGLVGVVAGSMIGRWGWTGESEKKLELREE